MYRKPNYFIKINIYKEYCISCTFHPCNETALEQIHVHVSYNCDYLRCGDEVSGCGRESLEFLLVDVPKCFMVPSKYVKQIAAHLFTKGTLQ